MLDRLHSENDDGDPDGKKNHSEESVVDRVLHRASSVTEFYRKSSLHAKRKTTGGPIVSQLFPNNFPQIMQRVSRRPRPHKTPALRTQHDTASLHRVLAMYSFYTPFVLSPLRTKLLVPPTRITMNSFLQMSRVFRQL